MRDVADKFIRRTKIYRVVKDRSVVFNNKLSCGYFCSTEIFYRANFCINENQMDHALSYMYAEKYFSKEDQITVSS